MDRAMFEDILKRIHDEHNYRRFYDLASYISSHKQEFTPEQLDLIEFNINSAFDRFDPRDCRQIQKITLIYGPRNEQNLYGNKPITNCEMAHRMGKSLPDYLMGKYGIQNFLIFSYPMRMSMAAEAEHLSREVFQLKREIQKIRRPEREEPTYTTVEAETEEPTEHHATLTVILTPREYAILTKTPGEFPYRLLGKEGRDYKIQFVDNTREDIEKSVHEIERRASEELQVEREKRKCEAPLYSNTDLQNIERILCKKYNSRFPEYKCPSAIFALSRRIAEFLYANQLNWDSPGIDIGAIDLFLRATPVRVYTRDLADEVFRNFVSTLGKKEESPEIGECEPDTMALEFAQLYALDVLHKENRLNSDGEVLRNELIASLEKCGFRYDDYVMWADETDTYFRSVGTNLASQESGYYDRFKVKYG